MEAVPVIFCGFPTSGEAGFGLMFDPPEEGCPLKRGAFYFEHQMYMASWAAPHDMFRFWRAAQLVRSCPTVTPGSVQLHMADMVDRRERRPIDDGNYKWMLERIEGGQASVDMVMEMSPPKWLIDFLIEQWSDTKEYTYPWVITEEVRAGTIEWEDRFSCVGAVTPEESDRREALWDKLRPRYVETLFRIAKACGESTIRAINPLYWGSSQKDEILQLFDSGVEAEHGKYVVAALAFIQSQRSSVTVMAEVAMVFIGQAHPLALAVHKDQREQHYLHQTAAWVYKRIRGDRPFDHDELDELRGLLQSLLEFYFPWGSHEQQFRDYIGSLNEDTTA